MKFPVIDAAVSDRLINALCNTLMHSLWQGIVLAAVAGLIVIGTRKLSSALRYNLLISVLLLFAAGTLGTLVIQLSARENMPGLVTPSNTTPVSRQTPSVSPVVTGMSFVHFTNGITGYLKDHHNTIALIWFLIICARSVQLGVGLYGTYRLKYQKVFNVTADWEQRLLRLAEVLGIDRHVMILESGLAKVPLVIGHLKPVILMPVGLLTALTPGEVEAIFMHELAHIRRRDFLVNLLQSLMEIVFFFNPAVLWVSQLIRTERENCCDDLALHQTNNKTNYIRALLSCEQYWSAGTSGKRRAVAGPASAMAFPGGKQSLLHRVRRMADNRNHSLSLPEKTLLAVCLVVAGLCVSAFRSVVPDRPGTVLVRPTSKKEEPGTSNVPVYPQTHMDTFPKKIKKNRNTTNSVNSNDSATYLHDSTRYSDEARNYHSDSAHYSSAGYDSAKANESGAKANYASVRASYQHASNSYRDPAARQQFNDAAIKEILSDMLKDGIIRSADDDLSFLLSTKEFIVNDRPQDETIFQRYKRKYVPARDSNDWTWTHSYHRSLFPY